VGVVEKIFKEEGCTVSMQEITAQKNGKWIIVHVFRFLGPMAVSIHESPTESWEEMRMMI
jgi:hydrogenase maturation factor